MKLTDDFTSSPEKGKCDDVGIVFRVGRWYRDNLVRACTSNHLPVLFVYLFYMLAIFESGNPSSHTPLRTVGILPPTYRKIWAKIVSGGSAIVIQARGMCVYSTHYILSTLQLTLGQALERDGFRCVITDLYDNTSLKDNPELLAESERLNSMFVNIETSCILNELSGVGANEGGTVRTRQVSSSSIFPTCYLDTRCRCCDHLELQDLAQALAVNGIYETQNLLLLQFDLHCTFKDLDMWFEHTHEVCRLETLLTDFNSPCA